MKTEQLYPVCASYLLTIRDLSASKLSKHKAAEWLLLHGFDRFEDLRAEIMTAYEGYYGKT